METVRHSRHVTLTPGLYELLETEGAAEIPVGFFMAFRPASYERSGFPTRVRTEHELIRYVDHNFEPEVGGLFQPGAVNPHACYVNAFSPEERDLVNAVRDKVAALTVRRFGRVIRPMSNLLVQTAPFRILTAIGEALGKPSLRVFEAGPGLGYLGALLAMQGHSYVSFDVTQSLYLWQHLLLSHVAGDDFLETAFLQRPAPLFERRVTHLPWWHYTDMLLAPEPGFDVVYSNSNLCEMTPLALTQLLDVAPKLLAGSPVKLFVFMHGGDENQNLWTDVRREFDSRGYRKIRGLPFHAFASDDRDYTPLLDAFAGGVPHYNPGGSSERFDAAGLVAVRRAEAPVDVAFTCSKHGWNAPFLD